MKNLVLLLLMFSFVGFESKADEEIDHKKNYEAMLRKIEEEKLEFEEWVQKLKKLPQEEKNIKLKGKILSDHIH